MTHFYTDEKCFWHSTGMHAGTMPVGGWIQPPSGAGHAESPDSKRRLKSLIDVSGLGARLHQCSAAPITLQDALRLHPQTYLDKLKQVSDSGGGMLADNAPFGPGSYEIALLSAGLIKQAVADVYSGRAKNAYALTRPPGHHMAGGGDAMGFCFLANIPIAIEAAKAELGLGKVVILDWDVHHGNGQQSIYEARDDVLTISLHQENCYPPGYSGAHDCGVGVGEGYNINIPLLAGSGHDAYMYAFDKIVAPAIRKFAPELIVVACGFDANALDPLARMQLHSDSFREMAARTIKLADELCGGRLVMAHEGGYSESYVPFCGLAVVEELAGWRSEVRDELVEFMTLQQPSARMLAFQRGLIDEMAAIHRLVAL